MCKVSTYIIFFWKKKFKLSLTIQIHVKKTVLIVINREYNLKLTKLLVFLSKYTSENL